MNPGHFALTGAKHDERDTALDMIAMDPNLTRHGQILIADKGYRSAVFEAELADAGITLIRPAYKTWSWDHLRFRVRYGRWGESLGYDDNEAGGHAPSSDRSCFDGCRGWFGRGWLVGWSGGVDDTG